MSAHREPDKVADYARNARMRGLRVIIAGAGLSAALPRARGGLLRPAGGRSAGREPHVGRRRPRCAALDRADATRGPGRVRRGRRRPQRGRPGRAYLGRAIIHCQWWELHRGRECVLGMDLRCSSASTSLPGSRSCSMRPGTARAACCLSPGRRGSARRRCLGSAAQRRSAAAWWCCARAGTRLRWSHRLRLPGSCCGPMQSATAPAC